MQYKELPGTGVKVSKVAIGTWQFGHAQVWGELSPLEEYQRIVDYAVENGVNLIDTAKAYGKAEEVLGEVLQGKRDKVVLATKLSTQNYDYDTARYEIEGSLKRLRTDYIDLYQIHWPKMNIPGTWHRAEMEEKDYEEIFTSMMRLKEEGLIRFAGVSNFRLHHLRKFSQEALDFLVTDQVPYSLLWRFYDIEGVSDFCMQKNIGLLAYSPLGQGLLTGRFGREGEEVKEATRKANLLFNEPLYSRALEVVDVVKEVAEEVGATPAQVALKWAMEKEAVTSVLCGVRKLRHMEDNVKAVDVPLTKEHMERLEQASMKFHEGLPHGLELWTDDNRREVLEQLGIKH